ncbi:O-acetyl-ADP-ribose deacetylase [bacterium CPR1]|nr:O-acetyl-ADP-ribose deacetylase [bacterium CPR1]
MTRLILKLGDITQEEVDVIVNAANSGLVGGGGVDGAIHRSGGPAIMEACKKIRAERGHPPCPTGQAVMTTAGKLKAGHVVHTAGPIYDGGRAGEAEQLRSCYTSSLALAVESGARTVAFPSISTGVYGYPISLAARVAVQAVRDFVAEHPGALDEVRFVVFSPDDEAVYRPLLA